MILQQESMGSQRQLDNPTSFSHRSRLEIYGSFCNYCGETDETVLEIDHIIPRKILTRHNSILINLNEYITKHGSITGKELNKYQLDDNPFLKQVVCANCHKRLTAMQRIMDRYLGEI